MINSIISSLPFVIGRYDEVVKKIISTINQKKSNIILPCSLNDLSIISQNSSLKKIYDKVNIFTTDGKPLVWWMILKNKRAVDRVYGPDLMKDIIINTQGKNHKHVLFGSGKKTLNKLLLEIKKFAPKTNIRLNISPPFKKLSSKENDQYLDKIKSVKPTVLWIGLSSPKQVEFAAKWKKRLPHTTIFCVGAAFDFIAGTKPMAPRWMQNISLEWFFRLITEPRRLWKRYLVDIPLFLLRTCFSIH